MAKTGDTENSVGVLAVEIKNARESTDKAVTAINGLTYILNGNGSRQGIVTRLALVEAWRSDCEKRESRRFDYVKGLIIAVALLIAERAIDYAIERPNEKPHTQNYQHAGPQAQNNRG